MRTYLCPDGHEEVQYWGRGMSMPFKEQPGLYHLGPDEETIKKYFDEIQGQKSGPIKLKDIAHPCYLLRNVPKECDVNNGKLRFTTNSQTLPALIARISDLEDKLFDRMKLKRLNKIKRQLPAGYIISKVQ